MTSKTRIMLRSLRDGKYVAEADQWTELPAVARTFENATEADGFVREHELPDMELIIHRENASTLRICLRRIQEPGGSG